MCPDQIDNACKNESLTDLQVNLDNDLKLSISDDYINLVKQGRIIAKKSKIQEFNEEGVYLSDGSFAKTDVVVFGTSYSIGLEFFDKSVLEALELDVKNYKNPIILYENTFHPNFENLAFVGLTRGFFFPGAELQAKWACKVFGGKISLGSKTEMREQTASIHDKRIEVQSLGLQFPYGSYVDLVDSLANKLNLLPDFESLKRNNPYVYEMLWSNACLPFHFMFNDNYDKTLELLKEVEEYTKKRYSHVEVEKITVSNFK